MAEAVPKATAYRLPTGVALVSAVLALGFTSMFHPTVGVVVGYVIWPFLIALVAWVVAGILRLRLVGYLPGQPKDDDFIPSALQPWIRFWLLTRFGLLGGMVALVLGIVATAMAGWGVNYCIEALIYVVLTRIFIDLGFGAAFNLGIIVRRRRIAG